MRHSAKVKQQRAYITPELVRELVRYDAETGLITWAERDARHFSADWVARSWNTRHAGKLAFRAKQKKGYLTGKILDQSTSAHRLAWCYHYGRWPNSQIDHINGDPADNRIENLREVTGSENKKNIKRPANNRSGSIGVCRPTGRTKWKAYINVNGKQKTLGWFKRISDAAQARKAAEIEYGYHENHGRAA